MNDTLPDQSPLWLKVESICQSVFDNYGYKQLRTPIVESTHLFLRSIGADTDVVSKEMYTFDDRNGDSLSLRPEGTASCVRAGIENGLFYNQQQRIEAEVISLIQLIFHKLGLRKTELQINSLGDVEARSKYRQALVDYLTDFESELDEDSQRRLLTNPLRILDSKNPDVQAILVNAPSILDCLSQESASKFEQLQAHLNDLGIEFTINPKLVRGLDYYNDTVFEWVNADFGAQSTVCAGGRYDNMVEQLGGQATPGFGFGMGMERLIQILQEQDAPITLEQHSADVYLVSVGDLARRQAIKLQQSLASNGIKVLCHCGGGSMKNQFKKADKSGALTALIIGEDEAIAETVNLKVLLIESL